MKLLVSVKLVQGRVLKSLTIILKIKQMVIILMRRDYTRKLMARQAIRKVRIPTLPGIILILKVIVQQHQSFLLMPGETHRVL